MAGLFSFFKKKDRSKAAPQADTELQPEEQPEKQSAEKPERLEEAGVQQQVDEQSQAVAPSPGPATVSTPRSEAGKHPKASAGPASGDGGSEAMASGSGAEYTGTSEADGTPVAAARTQDLPRLRAESEMADTELREAHSAGQAASSSALKGDADTVRLASAGKASAAAAPGTAEEVPAAAAPAASEAAAPEGDAAAGQASGTAQPAGRATFFGRLRRGRDDLAAEDHRPADTGVQKNVAEGTDRKATPQDAAPPSAQAGAELQGQDASRSQTTAAPPARLGTEDGAAGGKPAQAQRAAAGKQASAAAAQGTAEEVPAAAAPAASEAAAPEGDAAAGQASGTAQPAGRATFFDRLRRTRENLASGFSSFMKGRNIDADMYDELETALLTSDLGVETTMHVIERLRNEARLRELHDAVLLKNKLHDILCDILRPCEVPLALDRGKKPYVILMVGVNGSGKTTTIGKLAQRYSAQGLKIMMAAGDTFRAAAIDQLKVWGSRTGIPVIAQAPGSDSASVLFDALTAAKARDIDLLICDTAGRLQNKAHLMDELAKIVRVMKKNDQDAPHEVMLVLDGTTGQNAISQAKTFSSVVNVTGLCLTKLDGTAKGGVVFALADKFRIPIRYIGIGEQAEDLREFTTDEFVDAIIGMN